MGWREWVRTAEVEPSLYAADFTSLGEQITHLLNAGARIFHFDIGDGHFVEPVTIGPIVLQSISPLVHRAGGVIDCHLMVDNPEHHFEQVKRAGGDSVTFHVEVTDEPWNTIKAARALDLGVGVAFNPETEVEQAVEASLGADLVPESLWRLRRLRKQLHENLFVQVDGGITAENVHDVRKVGADLVVAGSAIFGMEDLPRAYRRLVKALDEPA